MSQIQRIYVIMAIIMILLSISFVKCLPITSKPIENTPENLAWEAWLMLPPSPNERTRKITPKSIFILNGSQDGVTHNGNSNLFSNSGSSLPQPQQQIQCPPNHRIDNSKCIPTLSIDRDKIMIQEFAQLFGNPTNGGSTTGDINQSNSPNYNYDIEEYDYGDYNPDDALTDDITFTNVNINKPDFNSNEQPLKINLSLDKFPLPLDNSPEIYLQPFRAEATSAITDKVSPDTTRTTTEQQSSTGTATTVNNDSKTSDETTIPSDTTKTRRNNAEQFVTGSATVDPIKQINELEISVDNSDTNLYTTTITNIDTTTTVLPILNPEEESIHFTQKNGEENVKEILSTTQANNDIEIVTESSPDIEKELADSLAEESLLYDQLFQDNLTQISLDDGSTVDPIEATTIDDNITTESEEITTTTESEIHNIKNDMVALEQNFHPVVSSITSRLQNRNVVELHEDPEPIMETIENNNRFIYHHLGGTTAPSTVQPLTEKSNHAKDIAEQLRIINMIVEEKKRKSQQLKLRFPDDNLKSSEQWEGLHTDVIRFPDVKSSTSSFSFPANPFNPDKYLFHRRFLQSSSTATPFPQPDSTVNTQIPFAWLPNGWEVHHNGDRPLLIRYWSPKIPPTNDGTTLSEYQYRSNAGTDTTVKSVTSSAAASTTSGYRENSRSPTENLYREMPAVLGAARQWKHSSKR